MKIRKDLLKKTRFGDVPNAWVLQAKGFRYAADMQLRPVKSVEKLVSTEAAFLHRFSYKVGCYLLAHSIELSLKAIFD